MAAGPSRDGNRWIVEKLENRQDIVVTPDQPKESVICNNLKKCLIQVKGKVTSISLNKCTETSVIFEDVVASFEVTNCDRVQIQVNGASPTIMIDKSSRVTLYLQSERSQHAEIITSLADQVNVVVPRGDNDPLELSIPTQFKTVFAGGALRTEEVKHVGV